MVLFGLALGTSEVIATNDFHEFALDRLQARPGKSREFEIELNGLRGYVTSPVLEVLIKQAKTKVVDQLVLLEWYVAFDDEHKLVLPNGPRVNKDKRAKTFKTISSALTYNVVSRARLDELKQDFAQFRGGEAVRMPMKIIIHLGMFQQLDKPKDNAADAGRPCTGLRIWFGAKLSSSKLELAIMRITYISRRMRP